MAACMTLPIVVAVTYIIIIVWQRITGRLEVSIINYVVCDKITNKSSAVAKMGDRGHNRYGPKRGGCCAPFGGGLGSRLTRRGIGRGLHAKCHLDPSSQDAKPIQIYWVPQTCKPISADGPKFSIWRGHVEKVLLFNMFFRLSIHA